MIKFNRRITFILLLCALYNAPADEVVQSEQHDFIVESVLSDLDHPWSMVFLADEEMLISERSGSLMLVNTTTGESQYVKGLPEVAAVGQGGLMDIALHPDFSTNGLIYLSFAASDGSGTGTEVARGKLVGNELRDVETLFAALPKSGGGRHFGSRLLFDPEGFLYITLGDRGKRPQAQALTTHPGSIIRLNEDGTVPVDNPFVKQSRVRPEIYTYGNRNVQGIALQPGTNRIWAHEHGPQGGDEVNIVVAGTNYGWPIITYGKNYGTGTDIGEGTHKEGMAQPVYQWTPSIAPSGMAFYSGDMFPHWQGDLFVGSLKFQLLVRLEVDGDKIVAEEQLLQRRFGRIRDVRVGPDGLLYLLTDESDGQLLRLQPR
ncbi:MAG: PQQ-dependent sugar dehydrogenase [Arenicellales bacterium]|nr:PQQ-dependent sugar dehydrogenase [Arenicellales bacterium]